MCSGKQPGFRIAVVFTVGLAGTPVAADRHCFPALDSYYDARRDLMAIDADCSARLNRAVADLDLAISDAEICGCAPLTGHLRGLLERATAPGACSAAVASLLHAEETTRRRVTDCH